MNRDFRVEIGIFAGGMLAILTPTSGLPSRPFIDFFLKTPPPVAGGGVFHGLQIMRPSPVA
ncbi:hypothetical protein, partial [Pseudomonas aeruginosa]|uniref:hypothetical protein n=1 Tax=Pseudomonas aeruginosa TaxID=287 RepID=UPI0031B6CED3